METLSRYRDSRFWSFLHSHPWLLLLLLTPGIPEYLSGSSTMSNLTLHPVLFLIFLLLNVCLYGPGVLLIREAIVRWMKGWASVILLGAAYALYEEGFALRTTFTNNTNSTTGNLASYGHWMGVNWVWVPGILIVHIVFSISLPILLFGLTFPELKGKSLLSRRKIIILLALIILDGLVLIRIVNYTPEQPIIPLTILTILLLIIAARRIPRGALYPRSAEPRSRPRTFAILGLLVLPLSFLTGGLGAGLNAPPIVTVGLDIAVSILLMWLVLRSLGAQANERHKLALSIGLIFPLAVVGFLASFNNPLGPVVGFLSSLPGLALENALMFLYLRGLLREYRPVATSTSLNIPQPNQMRP